ncbi:MAG: sulfopyruvate decarboxylase subunit alpha [Promethearchaeota archaeon]
MSTDQKLYNAIKESGISLILSVPCAMIKGLLEIIDDKNEIQHLSVTREEEGVGIAAGAYLGGRIPALLMQNSGLGNSINAIKSLLEIYEIPIIFIMTHRGAEGEKIIAQIPMGQVIFNLLDCINVEHVIVDSEESIGEIIKTVKKSQNSGKSIAIVLKRTLWGVLDNEKI